MKLTDITFTHGRILAGAGLIYFTLCLSLITSNATSYMYSLFFCKGMKEADSISAARMGSISQAIMSGTFFISDILRKTIGLRWALLTGLTLTSSSFLLTYFTVTHSVWSTLGTFGVLQGLGQGITIPTVVLYVSGWFEDSFGVTFAFITSAAGLGGIVYNFVLTAFINPSNLSPNFYHREISYFSQIELIDKIPTGFIIIGIITSVAHGLGFCLLKTPPPPPLKDCELVVSEKQESSQKSTLEASSDEQIKASTMVTPDTADESPFQILKSETFYIVWFSSFAMSLNLLITSTYYKMYGQIWIHDDKFLALVGSMSSLSVVFSRIFCGTVLDKCGVKWTLLLHNTIIVVFMSTWYLAAIVNKWLFLLSTVIIMCVCNNVFILYPMLTLKLFHNSRYGLNVTLVQSAKVSVMILAPSVLTSVLYQWSWFGLFSLAQVTACLAFVLVLLRMPRL